MTPGTCDECGLPTAACSTIAFFRAAVKLYQRGDTARADEMAKEAEDWWSAYRVKQGVAVGQK
jgi:hypothetical protein